MINSLARLRNAEPLVEGLHDIPHHIRDLRAASTVSAVSAKSGSKRMRARRIAENATL